MGLIPITKYEKEIYNTVNASRQHMTADQIYGRLRERYPGVSLATVYNNLHKLCEVNLIRKISVEGAVDRYDHIGKHDHVSQESLLSSIPTVGDSQDEIKTILETSPNEFTVVRVRFEELDRVLEEIAEEMRVDLLQRYTVWQGWDLEDVVLGPHCDGVEV